MANSTSTTSLSLFNQPFLSRIRRNHGLEHATLHVLAESHPRTRLAGHSDMNGFWIIGNITENELRDGVFNALSRLRSGESQLAVHPNCGTNFATSGLVAGLAAALSMFGAGNRLRDKLERVPLAITLATLALIVAQPLGLIVQRKVTTSGNPGELEVLEIRSKRKGKVNAYRVVTRG
jgi:hypothetical protein